jgi:hypothetical protein
VVRFPSERSCVSDYFEAMEEFSEFIFMQILMDLLLEGCQFTWSNNQED